MKKLMFVAATAAMVGGAFAEVNVYDITIKGDTINKVKSYKVTDEDGDKETCYYAEKGSISLKGLYAVCWCGDSVEINADGVEGDGFLAIWNASEKKSYINNEDGTKYLLDYKLDGVRFGKKSEKVGILTALDLAKKDIYCNGAETKDWESALVLAGFGTAAISYDEDADANVIQYIKSVSGSAVGTMSSLVRAWATSNCGVCEDNDCGIEDIPLLGLCDDFNNWCDDGDAVAAVPFSGTWKMKYNSKASKACTKVTKYILDYVPVYCK